MYGSVNIPLSNGSSRWDDCQITIPFPRAPNILGVSDAQHPLASKIQDDCGIDSHRTVMVVDLLLVIFMVTWKLAVVMAKGQQ